jgi:hypothetical protein
MAKHFLYLTNDKLIALIWKSGAIVGKDTFGGRDADSQEFGEYLAKHRDLPTYFVIDLIEEDFRLDTIPHLRGGDQDAVIARKLGQVYRATNFRHAYIQGREEDGRRDDKILMHAITNPDLLKPWLLSLERAQVPLEGVYSSPVLSGRLLKDLDVFFPHTLLVTIVPDFGLRQTYFQNKQVKFSRLTPIVDDESHSMGALVAAETSRTWQYLDSLRYFTSEDTLEVCILVYETDRIAIAEAIRTFPLLKYRFLDITEVASKIKLKPAPTSSHAEEVLVHLFAQSSNDNHFAEAVQTRFATFRRARIGLFAATAVVLLAGAIGAGFNMFQAAAITSEIERRNLIGRGIQNEYQAVSDSMAQQKLASDSVRDTSIFFNSQIRPHPATPGPLLREVADIVAEFPQVRVVQVVWTPAGEGNVLPFFTPVAAQGPTDVRSEMKGPATAQPPAAVSGTSQALVPAPPQSLTDPNPPLPGNKFHVAVVEGSIVPFRGDMRAALAEIERFRARLELAGLKTTVLTLPLDTRPVATIFGGATKNQDDFGEARFSLRVARAVTT